MTVRKIVHRPGSIKLGTVATSTRSNASHKLVKEILVGPGQGFPYRVVFVETKLQDGKTAIAYLSESAAVEVAKGILQNLPDADDELQAILREAVARSDAESRAVVEAVKENRMGR